MKLTVNWPSAGVRTAAERRRISRKLDRRNNSVAAVLTEMKRGAALHLHYQHGRPRWQLSSGPLVTEEVAKLVTARPEIIPGGDSLFLDMPAQTWRLAPSFHQKRRTAYV